MSDTHHNSTDSTTNPISSPSMIFLRFHIYPTSNSNSNNNDNNNAENSSHSFDTANTDANTDANANTDATDTTSATTNTSDSMPYSLDSSHYNGLFQRYLLKMIPQMRRDTIDRLLLLYHENGDWSLQGQPPAADKVMHALPIIYSPFDDPAMLNECAICQEVLFSSSTIEVEAASPFIDSDNSNNEDAADTTIRQMPCQHGFHESCLFPWLHRSNTCPCCRWELDTDNSDYNRVIHRRRSEQMATMGKLPCALTKIHSCGHTNCNNINKKDDDKMADIASSNDNGNEHVDTEMIILPGCGCGFHKDCLSDFLRISGDLPNTTTESSPTTTLHCPMCRQLQDISTNKLQLL
ncbi:hypothetical protein BDF19DRAFT_428560 [Syncephalis fuscata]|nr:hypothetical protein BDF19DRAFT_428560 [Syncephalis fuscata]